MVPDRAAFVVNYFSFFTILSNALAAIVLLIGAWIAFSRRSDPDWFNLVRMCAVTYMTTTFVVYNLLLRGLPTIPGGSLPWSNEVLHVAVPLLVLLDWLLAPDRRALGYGAVGRVVVFPLAWVAVTLARGDFAAQGIGTVTHVIGNKVLGFGHPMMEVGATHLPTAIGKILWVMSSQQRSFKVGEAARNLGTLIQDRESCIVVDESLVAPTIPTTVEIIGDPTAPKKKWAAEKRRTNRGERLRAPGSEPGPELPQ